MTRVPLGRIIAIYLYVGLVFALMFLVLLPMWL